MAAPDTARTPPLADGLHSLPGEPRWVGAGWIAQGLLIAIVALALCILHPSVETVVFLITSPYAVFWSIRYGVERVRSGMRVSVDGVAVPGTRRLVAWDEIVRFEIGPEDEHARLAPAVGKRARMVPSLVAVMDRGGRETLVASKTMPSSWPAAQRRRLVARRGAALNERLRVERSS